MLDGKTQHPIRIAGIDTPEKSVAISATATGATSAACSATKGRTSV